MTRPNINIRLRQGLRQLLLLLVALFGCLVASLPLLAVAQADAERSKTPDVLRIATYAYVKNGKVELGAGGYYGRVIQEQWLEKSLAARGVRLQWVPVTGDTGPVINEAFSSGRIDFATYGDLPSFILNAAGVRTQVVVPSGHGTDIYLVVPWDSTARSLADLKGKRISIHRTRPWELGMIKHISGEGYRQEDFRIINLEQKAGEAALAGGRVDALYTNQPFLLEERKLAHIIWSSRSDNLAKMRAELWGRSDFIQRYPDLTQIVATAFVRAQYWASQSENREQFIRDAALNGTPESVVRRTYEDPDLPWKDRWSPLFDGLLRTQYANSIAVTEQRKLIRTHLTVDELLAPQFVTAALRELKLDNYWQPWPLAQNLKSSPLPAPSGRPGKSPGTDPIQKSSH